MKKLILILAAFTVLAGGLAGCGKKAPLDVPPGPGEEMPADEDS